MHYRAVLCNWTWQATCPARQDCVLQQSDDEVQQKSESYLRAGRGLTEAMDLTPSFSLGHGALQLYGSAPDSWQVRLGLTCSRVAALLPPNPDAEGWMGFVRTTS